MYRRFKSKNDNYKNNDLNCKNCLYIRLFIISVVFLILLAFLQQDKLHYLKFVTPENAAIFIMIVGFFIFLTKLLEYFFNKK